MLLLPKNKLLKQRLIFSLGALLIFSLILIAYLTIRVIHLRKSPPFLNVGTLKTKTVNIPCNQRTNQSGWEIKNNKLITYPHCLTVMNSRFGSRFNLDWYFSDQKVKSSVMGTLEDKDIGLGLKLINNKGNKETVFPISPNSSFNKQTNELGLTYQKINFENEELIISLTIKSPFSESLSADDENTKLSSAPFFYLQITGSNKTNKTLEHTLNFTLANPGEIKNNQLYFSDPVRRDGLRALTAVDNNIKPFIEGSRGGFSLPLNLKPKTSTTFNLIYTGFLDGGAITDISNPENKKIMKFTYTRWFKNLKEVISYAQSNYKKIENNRTNFEKKLVVSPLSPQQKWLTAQAFHSYIGNTWLIDNNFFVWEGEFKYLNTVDVAHDYDILPGLYFPWAIKLELNSWAKSVKEDKFGKVIPHDLGGRFDLKYRQEYAIEGNETSGMPVEENCNFILLAYWYYHQTKDTEYIKQLLPLIKNLCQSLINRDTNNNGIADQGIGMTTYDNDGNLALKNAPDSNYLGIKQLSAYLAAKKMFIDFKDKEGQQLTNKQAKLIAESLKQAYGKYGFIPLSLDPDFQEKDGPKGTQEQGFAFITGLFYPALTSLESPILKDLLPILSDSYKQAYKKSLVKDENGKTYGLQLAEHQSLHLGWLSHSAMADYIAKKLFNQDYNSSQYWFPLLYDNPYSFADGQYFNQPSHPETTLIFYPRAAAIFSLLNL